MFDMPCWFCDNEKCGFISMTNCEKLNMWIRNYDFDKYDKIDPKSDKLRCR